MKTGFLETGGQQRQFDQKWPYQKENVKESSEGTMPVQIKGRPLAASA
jgi:hypothetical protein